MMVATIFGIYRSFLCILTYTFRLCDTLRLGSSGSATTHPWMFLTWTLSFNIGLNMLYIRIPLCHV